MNKSLNKSSMSRNAKPAMARKAKRASKPRDRLQRDVSAPAAKGRVVKNQKPQMTGSPNGDILIEHREYINDVAGSINYAVSGFPINPGLPGSFPWLSTVARSYESYFFEELLYEFETQAPTTTPGTVMLSADYDPSDSAPTSKTQAMAYRSSVRCPSWSDCEHRSLREDLSKRTSYFVRGGSLNANEDVKLYDVGNLFVSTQAQSGATNIGELYVRYRVRLMTPQIGKIGVGEAVYGLFAGSSNAAPFASKSGNLPASVVSGGTTTSSSVWTFTQPWEGYVTITATGTSVASITPSGTADILELYDVVNSVNTQEISLTSLSAQIGQTFSVQISNATLTTINAYFAQADS